MCLRRRVRTLSVRNTGPLAADPSREAEFALRGLFLCTGSDADNSGTRIKAKPSGLRGKWSKCMNVMIVGCDKIGVRLAKALNRYGHSVAVVDRDPEKLQQLGLDFTGVTF